MLSHQWATQCELHKINFSLVGETWHVHLGVVGCGFGFVGDNFDWTEKVR